MHHKCNANLATHIKLEFTNEIKILSYKRKRERERARVREEKFEYKEIKNMIYLQNHCTAGKWQNRITKNWCTIFTTKRYNENPECGSSLHIREIKIAD